MNSANPARLARALFTAWPFVTFMLPAMVCWGVGDLEQVFLIPASLIIIPVGGLLGLIPYFVARRRGWRVVPGNSIGILALNWWSWIAVAWAIPGKVTGGGRSSVLELLVFESMSRAWNERILIAALIIGVISWVVLLVTTASAGSARALSRMQKRVGLAVALGAPCVMLLAAMLGGTVEDARTDRTGDTPELAEARPIEEQLELLGQREAETQVALSNVRKLISLNGWTSTRSWMFRSCEREAHPCYVINTAAETTEAETDFLTRDRLADDLGDAGWQPAKKPQYCHGRNTDAYQNDDGQQLCVEYNDATISVAVISPPYWGDLYELRDAANPDALIFDWDAMDRSGTYRWDEWQASDLSLRHTQ